MAKPKHPAPKEYIPKVGNIVTMQGVTGRLVVIGVDAARKTAVVATPTTPVMTYTALWSNLSHLDESQNALRVVREATED